VPSFLLEHYIATGSLTCTLAPKLHRRRGADRDHDPRFARVSGPAANGCVHRRHGGSCVHDTPSSMVSSLPNCFLLFGSNPAKKLPPSLLQDGQLAIPWLHDRWSHEYSLSAFVTDLCTALQTSPASSCSPVHPLRLEMNQNNSKQLQPSAPTMPSGFGKHWDHPGLQRSSRFTHYCGLCVTSNRSDHGLASTDEVYRVQVQMAKVRVAIHCGHPQERRRVPATRQVAFLSPT
jgi:hypothetical protein